MASIDDFRNCVEAAIWIAVEEVNAQLPPDMRLQKTLTAPIMGAGRRLDSLGIVMLISAVEREMEKACGIKLVLADEAMMTAGGNPLATIGDLADYISRSR